jgi:signal transduction histidine kinase
VVPGSPVLSGIVQAAHRETLSTGGTMKKMNVRDLVKMISRNPSPSVLLVTMAISIFVLETFVMSVIHFWPFRAERDGILEGLVDALTLVVLLSPILYYVFFRPLLGNIEERKRTEEALQLERNKLKRILDAMEDGVCIITRQYDLEYVNPVLEREFLPVAGRKCYAYFHDRTDPCPWCRNEDVFTGRAVKWEWRSSKTGKIYEIFDSPFMNADGTAAKLKFLHNVTERKQTEEALRESERQLHHLSSQLLSAQEQERRRISRELHDELGQALTLMKLHIRMIKNKLRADQAELGEDCEHALRYLDQVIDDVRRLSRDLSPAVLEHNGLTAALRGLIDNFGRTQGIAVLVDLDIADLDRLFGREAQTFIYRIVQEALTNIGKHSGARNASIMITRRDGNVAFLIADDGRGFDVKQEAAKSRAERGLGLSTMDERVRMLSGCCELRSVRGGGTSITFTLPIPVPEEQTHEYLSNHSGG